MRAYRCAWLLTLAVAVSPARTMASDTFYSGKQGDSEVFTNIPHGQGFEPVTGFDEGAPRREGRSDLLLTRAFDDLIESTGRQYRVHPELIRAVIQVESAFNPTAMSPKGARGLMQLMPATARLYGISNLFDPVANLRAGVRHLAYLADVYGEDLNRVLAAYNAGEEAVRRFNGIPNFEETQRYVRKVKRLYTGPIRLKATEPEKPGFFTYEDGHGILHVSDAPIEVQMGELAEP